jgi:hypothetical protein
MMDTGSQNANSMNLEQLMQLGIQAARDGNKPSARIFFQQILDVDKQNERAWLGMAAVAEAPEERTRFLLTVLRINPNNQQAQRELQKLRQNQESSNTQVIRYGFMVLAVVIGLVAVVMLILLAIG